MPRFDQAYIKALCICRSLKTLTDICPAAVTNDQYPSRSCSYPRFHLANAYRRGLTPSYKLRGISKPAREPAKCNAPTYKRVQKPVLMPPKMLRGRMPRAIPMAYLCDCTRRYSISHGGYVNTNTCARIRRSTQALSRGLTKGATASNATWPYLVKGSRRSCIGQLRIAGFLAYESAVSSGICMSFNTTMSDTPMSRPPSAIMRDPIVGALRTGAGDSLSPAPRRGTLVASRPRARRRGPLRTGRTGLV